MSGHAVNIWSRPNLFGDIGGLRPTLDQYGITLNLQDAETLLGTVSGGVKQGATLQGTTIASLQVDTEKAFGVKGGLFNVSALQIHGNNDFSSSYLDDIQTANGYEAENSTRLWELWYDQTFQGGAFDIRLGLQSIDNEFMVSAHSGVFINTAAGWPVVPSADLYAGGPVYPLSALGVRAHVKLSQSSALLFGVFDDNPPGGPFDNDPQAEDAGGVRFNLGTGALFIAELQKQTSVFGGLSGTYKIGFWYDTGAFPDQAFDNEGRFLTAPDSDGVPAMHHGNFSLYGVVDQTVWQPKPNSARNLAVFARVMGAPGDRNEISFGANGGLLLTDPFPGRDNDSIGIDLGLAKVSGRAAELDQVTAAFNPGSFVPVRGTEGLIELTYQAQATPWLQIQPDLQIVISPGAGVVDPDNPTQRLGTELVAGIRTVVTF
jgi:porin